MQQNFSFDNTDRKMPYKVPEGFFPQLETSLNGIPTRHLEEKTLPAGQRGWMWMTRTSLAAAALVACIFGLTVLFPRNTTTPDQLSLEQAFSNLSAADQEYIIDTFRNDMIIDYR